MTPLQQLAHRLSPKWIPSTPDDLIGPARDAARLIRNAVAGVRDIGAPIKFLLLGKPGLGKSSIVRYLMTLLGTDRWHTTILNGTEVKVELIDQLAGSLHYKELFGAYRLINIEEVDKVPHVAQVRLLTVIDELPDFTAVICTSNCKENELEERFQTRFQLIEVGAPKPEEIKTLLMRYGISQTNATQIATFACGNVRAALNDALGILQRQPQLLAA